MGRLMLSFKEFINERNLMQSRLIDKLKSLLDTSRYTIEKKGREYHLSWGKDSMSIGSGRSYEEAFMNYIKVMDLDDIQHFLPDELYDLFSYAISLYSKDSADRQINALLDF